MGRAVQVGGNAPCCVPRLPGRVCVVSGTPQCVEPDPRPRARPSPQLREMEGTLELVQGQRNYLRQEVRLSSRPGREGPHPLPSLGSRPVPRAGACNRCSDLA